MAFYIVIIKQDETSERVIYAFGKSEEQMGYLEVKKNGTIRELKATLDRMSTALFERAKVKVHKAWIENKFPHRMTWES